jgi:hypothetical protein
MSDLSLVYKLGNPFFYVRDVQYQYRMMFLVFVNRSDSIDHYFILSEN